MLCNYYTNNIDEQPGDQPIRVFFNTIQADFLNIKDALVKIRPNENFDEIRLEFLTENVKILGPSTNGQKITLHDTFLSFLWSYIYSILILTPMGGKEFSENDSNQAMSLRNYALRLIKEYVSWDKENLPNPELFSQDPNGYIGVTNAVFIFSIRFILFHEFAHIFLGHPFISPQFKTSENIKKMEIDADNLALDWAINSNNDEEKFTSNISLLAALNSLSFSPNKFSNTETHPSPEDRILTCLNRLKLDDNDFLWGYAMCSIMEWQVSFALFYIPNVNHNFKSEFLNMLSELKEYKRTGISKFKK